LVQRFIPWKINRWDRARWLEDSWAYAYHKHSASPANPNGFSTLDSTFLSLWPAVPDYRQPCLFLNSTVVETGQKAIAANVRLSPRYFVDVVDVHHTIGKSTLLKTAASVSARFPYITPAATLLAGRPDTLWGHAADGGYFENTGLSTAVEVFNLLSTRIDSSYRDDTFPSSLRRKIRAYVLYIRNNNYDPGPLKPMRGLYEIRTPPEALLNAWDRGSVATSNDVQRVVRKLRLPAQFDVYSLNRHSKVTLPLGWFLSETARKEMNGQLDTLRNSSLLFIGK
jgi:hypothetical protein